MADLVTVANRALALVGQQQILSLTDPGSAAAQANLFIVPAIREVLQKGAWTSARRTVQLNQLTASPPVEWNYAYQLPNDFLRIVDYNELDAENVVTHLWEIEGPQLLSDDSPVYIRYVYDITNVAAGNNPSLLDETLTELFELNLASKMAFPFQQTTTLKKELLAEYDSKLKKALSADARASGRGLRSRTFGSNWVNDRRFSTNA